MVILHCNDTVTLTYFWIDYQQQRYAPELTIYYTTVMASTLRTDKRSLLCTIILVPLVVVLLVLSWFRGGIPNQQTEPSSPEDSTHPTEHVVAGYFVDW